MNKWSGLLFLGGFIATPTALAAVTGEPEPENIEAKLECNAPGCNSNNLVCAKSQ